MHLLISEFTYQSEKDSPDFLLHCFGMPQVDRSILPYQGSCRCIRGYNPCFSRVEATNAPPRYCLSFGPGFRQGPTLFWPWVNKSRYPWVHPSRSSTRDLYGERAHIRAFIYMCAIHATSNKLFCIQSLTPLLFLQVGVGSTARTLSIPPLCLWAIRHFRP